jgi:hypothetical protein
VSEAQAAITADATTRAPSDIKRDVALFLVNLVYDADPLEMIRQFAALPAPARLCLWQVFRTLRDLLMSGGQSR